MRMDEHMVPRLRGGVVGALAARCFYNLAGAISPAAAGVDVGR